jgi:hypothetical protein
MKNKNTQEKVCFVISPIGSADSDTRKHADEVLECVFKAALEPLGYSVMRADEISVPGSITLQVLEKIRSSELMIADLTGLNPNVFYELALRHAIGKPVIQVIDASQKIPFDIADLRTISLEFDPMGVNHAIRAIQAQTEQIESGQVGQTSMKLAGVLHPLTWLDTEREVYVRARRMIQNCQEHECIRATDLLPGEKTKAFKEYFAVFAERMATKRLEYRIVAANDKRKLGKKALYERSQIISAKNKELVKRMEARLVDQTFPLEVLIVGSNGVILGFPNRVGEVTRGILIEDKVVADQFVKWYDHDLSGEAKEWDKAPVVAEILGGQ